MISLNNCEVFFIKMQLAIEPHVSIPGYVNTAENGFIKYQVYDINRERIHESVDFWFVFEKTVYTDVNLSFAASMDEKYGGLYWVNNEHRRAFQIWSGGPVHAIHLAYGDNIDSEPAFRLFWSVNETKEDGAIIYYIEQKYDDIKYTASMCFDIQNVTINTIMSEFTRVTFLHTSSAHQTALFVCDLDQQRSYCELYTDINNTTAVYTSHMSTPIFECCPTPYKIPFYRHKKGTTNEMELYEHQYNSLVPGVTVYTMTHKSTAVYYFMTPFILYVFHYVGYDRLTKPVSGDIYVKSVHIVPNPGNTGFTYEVKEVDEYDGNSLMKKVGIDHIEAIDLRNFINETGGDKWLGYVDYQTNAYLPNISRILFTYRTNEGEIKLKEIISNGSIEMSRGMKESTNRDITLGTLSSSNINLDTSAYTKRHGGVSWHSDKRCYLFVPGKIYIIKAKTKDTVHLRAELVSIMSNDLNNDSMRYSYEYNAMRTVTNTTNYIPTVGDEYVPYSVTVVRINACIHTYSTVKNSTCVFCINNANEGIEINVENDSILQLRPAISGVAGRVSSHMYSIYCDSNGIYAPFEKAFNVDAELTGKTITEIRDMLTDMYSKINDIWYRTQKISYRP